MTSSKLEVLTPANCQVIFIDHQPQMAFGVQSIDRQVLKNNTVALAKAAKVFNIPTIITTVETESFSGNTYPELLDVFPGQDILERTSMNSWDDQKVRDALGTQYTINGETRFTGTWGDIGTSSFYPPHHMTMGEGGCVYTNSPLLNRLIKSYRDWGRDCICPSGHDNFCGHRFDGQYGELPAGYDHKYVYSHFGYNLKVTDMQAAIGCEQLKKFPSFIERRRHNWDRLRAALEPAADKLILPEPAANSRPSWFGFLISVKPESGLDRNAVTRYVESHNVQTRLLFSGNLIKHPCFDQIRGTDAYRVAGELTNTDFIMNNTFWVGVYPGMTDEMIDYMAKIIIEAVNQ